MRGPEMVPDTTPEKPEWFELAEGDAKPSKFSKVKSGNKKLPAIAVLITGAVIATGAFFANAAEENHSDDGFVQTDMQNPNGGAPVIGDSTTATTPGAPGVQPPGSAPGMVPPNGDHDGDGWDHHDDGDGPRPPHREDGDDDGDDDGEHHRERGDHGSQGGAPTIPTPAPTK